MSNLHTIGTWYTSYGSMLNRLNEGIMLDEDIAILVTINKEDGVGTLHKVGKKENLIKYRDTAISKYIEAGLIEFAEEWQLITFNVKWEELGYAPEGYNFNIDEVCTLVNWLQNCSCQNLQKFFSYELEDIKKQIADLQKLGY